MSNMTHSICQNGQVEDLIYVLQCVALCSGVLRCVAVCCSVLLCGAVCSSSFRMDSICCSVLQCVAVCCSVLQCVAVCCNVLQCVAVCCGVSQCVASFSMDSVNMSNILMCDVIHSYVKHDSLTCETRLIHMRHMILSYV